MLFMKFPLTILPTYVQQITWLLPFSWAYLVGRKVFFQGLAILSPEYLAYTVATVLTLTLGYLSFKKDCYDRISNTWPCCMTSPRA